MEWSSTRNKENENTINSQQDVSELYCRNRAWEIDDQQISI